MKLLVIAGVPSWEEFTDRDFDLLGRAYQLGYRFVGAMQHDAQATLYLSDPITRLSDEDMEELYYIYTGLSDTPYEGDGNYTLPSGNTYDVRFW